MYFKLLKQQYFYHYLLQTRDTSAYQEWEISNWFDYYFFNTKYTKAFSSVCFASHFVQITMLLSLEFYFDKWHSNCCLKCDGLSLLLEAKKLQRVIQIHHTVVKLHFVSNQQNSFNVFDESSRWYYIRLLPVQMKL